MKVIAHVGDQEIVLEVARAEGGHAVVVEGHDGVARAQGTGPFRTIAFDGRAGETSAWRVSHQGPGAPTQAWDVLVGGRLYAVRLADPLAPRDEAEGAEGAGGPIEVRAVMPGKVVAILASEGAEVEGGQGLRVVEAMKMETESTAPRPGKVGRVAVRPGEAEEAGEVLLGLEPPDAVAS